MSTGEPIDQQPGASPWLPSTAAPEADTGPAPNAAVASPAVAPATDPVTENERDAVNIYCTLLLPQEVAPAAAHDAIEAYRLTLSRSDPPVPPGPQREDLLLAVTRLMAAVSMPDRSSPADRRRAVWASIGAESHCSCRETSVLLAARANGNIEERESAALDEHLRDCADCRSLAESIAAAEAGFRATIAPIPTRSGLRSARGAALLSASALLIAGVAAGAVALTSHATHPVSRAAVITQSTSVPRAVSTTTPAVAAPVRVRHHARPHPAVHHHHAAVHHHHAAVHHRAAVHHAAPVVAAQAPDTAVDTVATQPAATEQPVPYTAPASSSASRPVTASAPATASVSGGSSLPSISAPQQGISGGTSPSGK